MKKPIDADSQNLSYQEGFQPFPLVRDVSHLKDLAAKYDVPEQDATLIALNASGIRSGDVGNDRGRFTVTMPNGRKYFMAVTITDKPLAPFVQYERMMFLDGHEIGRASSIEKDTCTDSYWRGGKRHLTLNSNSRSNCRGCEFCGTYSLANDDKALNNPPALKRKAEILCQDLGADLSKVESVGVVTGCFPDEQSLVNHLRMVRQVFGNYGFNRELRYIGSQLRTPEQLSLLASEGPFALYLTVEAFTRREVLMKRTKASLDLDKGRELLGIAKAMGIETTFLYIVGLDDLESMRREFPQYKDRLTRLPLVQTFQAYVPEQLEMRNPAAASLEYFLETRHIVEQSLPDLRPQVFSNYRGLWYEKYANEDLPNVVI